MNVRCLLVLLSATALFGETRVLRLANTVLVKDLQEIATLVRVITEGPGLVLDSEQKSITVSGTAEQLTAAAWIVEQLDREVALPGTLAFPGASDDVIALFTLPDLNASVELNEAATVARSMGRWHRLFVYTRLNAMVVRGTASDIAMAGWIFSELNLKQGWAAKLEYRSVSGGDDAVRIFHLKAGREPRQLQELVTVVRSIGMVERMFTFTPRNLVAARGSDAEIALCEWLIGELDGGSRRPGPEYKFAGDMVRIFYLAADDSVQHVQQVALKLRTVTKVPRLFTYNPLRAIVVRGTAEQLATAEQILAAK